MLYTAADWLLGTCVQGSVAYALVRAYWRQSVVCGLMLLVDSITSLAAPLVLQRLLTVVQIGHLQGVNGIANLVPLLWQLLLLNEHC